MKRKAVYAAIVAAVMGIGSPIQAQTDEIVYRYIFYENGLEVGEAHDLCYPTGQIVWRQIWWGYATEDVVVIPMFRCLNGQIMPIS